MFLLLLITSNVFALVRGFAPNVPVTLPSGSTAYADPKELLQKGLTKSLGKFGVNEVDIERKSSDNTEFEVELYSLEEIPLDFKDTLENILKSDLEFSEVEVKPGDSYNDKVGQSSQYKSVFNIYFNSEIVNDEMSALAEKVLKNVYFDLELSNTLPS